LIKTIIQTILRNIKSAFNKYRSSLLLTIFNYLTFVILSVTNFFLWRYIKSRNLSASAKGESHKHLYISVTFAVSYLYKGIFNNLYTAIPEKMNDF